MGFFSSSPKRITKKELEGSTFSSGLYGEIKHSAGFNDQKYHEFKAIVEGSMANKDHYEGKEWKNGIMPEEVDEIVKQMKDSGRFHEHEIAAAEEHFRKKL